MWRIETLQKSEQSESVVDIQATTITQSKEWTGKKAREAEQSDGDVGFL